MKLIKGLKDNDICNRIFGIQRAVATTYYFEPEALSKWLDISTAVKSGQLIIYSRGQQVAVVSNLPETMIITFNDNTKIKVKSPQEIRASIFKKLKHQWIEQKHLSL